MRAVVPLALVLLGCAHTDAAAPAPTASAEPEREPANVDRFEYVAGEDEVADAPTPVVRDDDKPAIEGDFALTTAEAVHTRADEAVADRLDPKHQWESSPVLPSQWPRKNSQVKVYYFPRAAHPDNTSHYELFSAAWVVQVSLVDGSANVSPIKGRRRLATLEDTRPSMLERSELAIAEQTLVETTLGVDTPVGENNYWGYLKYFREHPHVARDLGKRSPAFVKWLYRSAR